MTDATILVRPATANDLPFLQEMLYEAAGDRPVDALLANAGHGLGGAFLDQDWDAIQHVIQTNVTGTVQLVHIVGRDMRARGAGRILLTGSIAGFIPGTYQAVYSATKAFVGSFSWALRAEFKDTGVTVTCLMPGATETEFFERADMLDTKVGTQKKMSPEEVAKQGFEALLKGDAEVVTGWSNKLRAAISRLMPQEAVAEQATRPHLAISPDAVEVRERVVADGAATVTLSVGTDRLVPVELVFRQRVWTVVRFDGASAATARR